MKDISKELLGIDKYWKVVKLMVDGLKSEWMTIKMTSFGATDGRICSGCAATNAICPLAGRSFDISDVHNRCLRANSLGLTMITLVQFEDSINSLRGGFMNNFEIQIRRCTSITHKLISVKSTNHLTELEDQNWRQDLPLFESYYKELKEKDI